jgi:hypothetical protein
MHCIGGLLDGLSSSGTAVEGSGGASIQSLIASVLNNASATQQFGNAGLSFAPTDSTQGVPMCIRTYNSLLVPKVPT